MGVGGPGHGLLLGWNGTRVMVQDFPNLAFRKARVSQGWKKTKTHQKVAAFAVSKDGKRGRGEPGRVGVYKWCSNFPVISVGPGK